MMDLLVIVVCAMFLLMGLLMVVLGWEQVNGAGSAKHWPTAEGRIVSVQMEEVRATSGSKWLPRITYFYSIRGRIITGTQLSLGELPYATDEATASSYLQKYPPHIPVKVYYNPEHIAEAVLDPFPTRSTYLTFVLGVGLVFLGGWLFVLFDLMRRR